MKPVETILKLAKQYEKQASTPDVAAVKKVIKASIERLWNAYPSTMDGFLYISNVTLNNNTVSFTINLDKSKASEVTANKAKRDNLINNQAKNALSQTFGSEFDLGFVEVLV